MLDYTVSISGVDEAIAFLKATPTAVVQAATRTVNNLAKQGITAAADAITKDYNIKPKEVKLSMSVVKASKTASEITAAIHVHGKGIPLYAFHGLPKKPATQKGIKVAARKPTTAQIMRKDSRTTYPHHFVATMSTGHTGIYVRTGRRNRVSGRLNAIVEAYAFSIVTIFERIGADAVISLVQTKGTDMFIHELEYYMGLIK